MTDFDTIWRTHDEIRTVVRSRYCVIFQTSKKKNGTF